MRTATPEVKVAFLLYSILLLLTSLGCKRGDDTATEMPAPGPLFQTEILDASTLLKPDEWAVRPLIDSRGIWSVDDLLNPHKKKVVVRCEKLAAESLRQVDRRCNIAEDCIMTPNCTSVSSAAKLDYSSFEKAWKDAGCPIGLACQPPACRNGACF